MSFSVLQDWEEGDGKYVAPELLDAGVEPTPAADIYSLGATLYECATGMPQRLWSCDLLLARQLAIFPHVHSADHAAKTLCVTDLLVLLADSHDTPCIETMPV